jgi:geranylgeranyl pyrophosphate synthase
MMERKFEGPGDVEEALRLVDMSDGIDRTRALAVAYSERSVNAVMQMAPSPARDSLAQLAWKVAHRTS